MKITGAQVFEARGAFVSRDLYVDGGMLTDRDCGGEVLDAGGVLRHPRPDGHPFPRRGGPRLLRRGRRWPPGHRGV